MRKMSWMVLALLFLSGCAAHISDGPTGFLVQSTMIGENGNFLGGKKSGEACAHSIFGLIAFGDASVETAAIKASITSIGTVNHENTSVLGIYASQCTVVHGN